MNVYYDERRLDHIRDTQDLFVEEGLVETCLLLLNKSCPEITKEVLALLANLLFNANKQAQV